jgi:hypothetical protein
VSLLVHCVIRADQSSAARTVVWQDLAAVVSEWRTPTQQDALAHLQMLSELVVAGPVVPLKYGTTATDEEAVRAEVLASSAPRLRAHLDRLDGLVEVHVYLKFDEDEALRAVYDEHQPQWRGGGDLSARIHLGEQVARHLVTWRQARADALLAPISGAAAEQVPMPDPDNTIERRAFLIPHKEVEPARTAIVALGHLAGVTAEFVGPLPAYNFLTEQLEPAATNSRWGW